MPSPTVTVTVVRVLRPFLDDPGGSRYGFELMQLTGLPSGTIYPVLARLERAGWLVSRQEAVDPQAQGRPARRFYRLSAEGEVAARDAVANTTALFVTRHRRPPRPALGHS